jgi:hypothetical protein
MENMRDMWRICNEENSMLGQLPLDFIWTMTGTIVTK